MIAFFNFFLYHKQLPPRVRTPQGNEPAGADQFAGRSVRGPGGAECSVRITAALVSRPFAVCISHDLSVLLNWVVSLRKLSIFLMDWCATALVLGRVRHSTDGLCAVQQLFVLHSHFPEYLVSADRHRPFHSHAFFSNFSPWSVLLFLACLHILIFSASRGLSDNTALTSLPASIFQGLTALQRLSVYFNRNYVGWGLMCGSVRQSVVIVLPRKPNKPNVESKCSI
jgi:hypothetical protein